MERVSFVKNGELRLPPGFRFHPTDEELVVQYLKRKVLSTPLPFSSFIPDLLHLFKSDPWDLPGDMEQERYFFSRKEAKYPNGNRSNRATMSGYWKATGLDKHIISTSSSKGVLVVGMKKTLVFYRGKPPHGSRTDWIMHEYRLHSHSQMQMQSPVVPMQDWVLCRIFFKRRGSSKNAEALSSSNRMRNSSSKVVFYDFLSQNRGAEDPVPGASSSSSTATSGITEEVSTSDHHGEDDDDSSSCCNSKYLPNCFWRKLVP